MNELIEKVKLIPFTVFLVGGLGIAAAYYSLYYDNGDTYQAQINAAQNELSTVTQSLNETKAVISDKKKFEQEYNMISDQFKAALEYLPANFNIQNLLKQIYGEARTAGIDLEKITPQQSVPKEFYEELSIEVVLVGSYPQITLFLWYISKLQRIVNIRNIEVAYKGVQDDVPVLTMKGILVSYRYLEGR